MNSGSKLGIAATKKLLAEGFKRAWLPFIKMDGAARKKINSCSEMPVTSLEKSLKFPLPA
jgi:3-polyprenyl-4-hydroxybenzoate decarboxylase